MNAADFAAGLFDPSRPCPPGLCAWNDSDPTARYAVHRNNVVVSLVDVLGDAFPVVRAIVGADDFDRALAPDFVRAHPPRSPVLVDWGDALPAFIEGRDADTARSMLADVARLERARVRACHAADAPRLDAAAVAARLANPAALPGARLALHPSLHVVASRHPVVSIWAARQGEAGDLPSLDADRPETALVLRTHDGRDDDSVVVIAIDAPTARWLQAVAAGATLARAAQAAPGVDLAAAFALLLRRRALVGWSEG